MQLWDLKWDSSEKKILLDIVEMKKRTWVGHLLRTKWMFKDNLEKTAKARKMKMLKEKSTNQRIVNEIYKRLIEQKNIFDNDN